MDFFSAGELKFHTTQVKAFSLALQRPGGSPTDELLMEWSHKNATIRQLFTAFKKLKMIDMKNWKLNYDNIIAFHDTSSRKGVTKRKRTVESDWQSIDAEEIKF